MVELRDTPARRLAASKHKVLDKLVTVRDIIDQAFARNNGKRPSQLESLPNEIKLEIIFSLAGNLRSIVRLAMTGPQFCALIKIHENAIARNVVICIIPPELIEIAAASHAASYAAWNHRTHHYRDLNKNVLMRSTYSDTINKFVDGFRDGLYALEQQHKKGLRLYEANQYVKMQNIVSYYAKTLSDLAQKQVPEYIVNRPKITPLVGLRYQKSLYIAQLVGDLFSWRAGTPRREMNRAWGVFWYAFMPWEQEQVYVVHKLLEQHISKVMRKSRGPDPHGWEDDITAVPKFVTWLGPKGLWTYEKKGPRFVDSYFRVISGGWDLNEFIALGYCHPGFGMSVQLERIARTLEAGQDHLEAFGKFHFTPMINWYRLLLSGDLVTGSGPYARFFSCVACLVKAGYAFWGGEYKNLKNKEVRILNKRATKEQHRAVSAFKLHRHAVYPFRFRLVECVCSDVPTGPANSFANSFRARPQIMPYPQDEYCFCLDGQEMAEPLEIARTQASTDLVADS
ncbi:hypothetical protein GGR51DRAFT_567171 [Nemania sp. FL0031]|nr:hypothetical protein GGR51DRAFT_567171 [Nemania sp. FL0031]